MKKKSVILGLQVVVIILLIVIIYYGSVAWGEFENVKGELMGELGGFKKGVEEVKSGIYYELGLLQFEFEKGVRVVKEEVEKIRAESKEGIDDVIEVLQGLNETNNQLKERIGRIPY